ncbi:MAG: spermidine synthase [Candidatus Omnitrophica bacterium]|nr:spermidine synthase [Candidatus Omnitrophota bacterium]
MRRCNGFGLSDAENMTNMTTSNLEILAYEETPLGKLCLRRRRPLHEPETTVTEITLNHEFLMSSYYTDSERALASVALQMHGGKNLDILIGGLGLGYTVAAALQGTQVASAEVVEFLPQVIAWMDQGLVPLAAQLGADQRLRMVEGDIYGRLAAPPQKTFDVILIDVDHSPDERLDTGCGRFYTREGLRAARDHLTPGGVLAVWSYAQDSPFADALRSVFGDVRIESVSFVHKFLNNEKHTDWLFFARR